MSSPDLTIGMIFKNEAHCLERCMKSLQPLREAIPCELIMADTGATDGSREIAARYADILLDFPWIHDFAAARNAVLERASGRWFLTVDCDEWLDPDFQKLVKMLQNKRSRTDQFGGMLITQRNIMSLTNPDDFADSLVPRLFRIIREPDRYVHYEGKIHEVPVIVSKMKKQEVVYGAMPDLILNHDGYATDNKELHTARLERNIALLDEELERSPNDVRTLVQRVQSARNEEERFTYAKRMIAALPEGKLDKVAYAAAAYKNGVMAAHAAKEYELVYKWLEEGVRRLPESMMVRIDGNYTGIMAAHSEKKYEKALQYGAGWREAVEQYDRGEGWVLDERAFGQLLSINKVWREKCGVVLLRCACRCEDWEAANSWAEFLQSIPYLPNFIQLHASLLIQHADHIKFSGKYIRALWDQCMERVDSEDAAVRAEGCKSRNILMALSIAAFTKEVGGWRARQALADTGDCDLGRSARILNARDAEEARVELEQIGSWDYLLAPAMTKVLRLGMQFPESFVRRPAEALAELPDAMAIDAPDFAGVVLRWAEPLGCKGSLPELLWRVDLTATALFRGGWENDAQSAALCRLFAVQERELLNKLYRLESVGEDLSVLPAIHRFGYCLLRGLDALEAGDPTEYVRFLRQGLKEVPASKDVVGFLCDHMDAMRPRSEIDQELLDLAEQVKGLLAQYAPDDPAVLELKGSPAYQKVAWIIEDPIGGLTQ